MIYLNTRLKAKSPTAYRATRLLISKAPNVQKKRYAFARLWYDLMLTRRSREITMFPLQVIPVTRIRRSRKQELNVTKQANPPSYYSSSNLDPLIHYTATLLSMHNPVSLTVHIPQPQAPLTVLLIFFFVFLIYLKELSLAPVNLFRLSILL